VVNLSIELRHQIRLNYHFIIVTFPLTRKAIHEYWYWHVVLVN